MSAWLPECPRCGSRALKPEVDVVAGFNKQESFPVTHRCKCGAPLRVTLPEPFVLRRIATTALVAPPGATPSADPAILPVKEIT